jgi:dCMP deaminase
MPMIVIGLTGPNGAGKQAVIDYLVERHGFTSSSLSDQLRARVRERGQDVTRANLIATGNELREELGPGALGTLAREALTARWSENGREIIDSIRHPEEVRELSRRPFFLLVAVDAPLLVRFERARRRDATRGEGEPLELAAFAAVDDAESFGTAGASSQCIRACMALARVTVVNGGSLEALHARLDALDLTAAGWTRPGWDAYFLGLARLAAQRTNCMKRCVGAVVVSTDHRVIATGYNGTGLWLGWGWVGLEGFFFFFFFFFWG